MSIDKVGSGCCGCRNCLHSCPYGAIGFTTDIRGFEYPVVNPSKCVECGLCERLCPELRDCTFSNEHLRQGAAYALSDEIKLQGSSGGFFGLIARDVIEHNGVIYGAAFDNKLQLKTTRVETIDGLDKLYKSKYLLCDTNNQFRQIKEDLTEGRYVMYCSSPCQIAALKLFLHKDYTNLLLVEFVCHGVGSQTLFDQSVSLEENKRNIQILDFIFRYKYKKASSHYYCYKYEKNGKIKSRKGLYLFFPYYNAYCKQLVSRDSCYTCKFAKPERCADITIGDFHSINKYLPDIDRFAGVSMFVCNTQKGADVFNGLEGKIEVIEFPWETIERNNRFSCDNKIPAGRSVFFDYYLKGGLSLSAKKELKPVKNIKQIIYYNLPHFIRTSVLKLIHSL